MAITFLLWMLKVKVFSASRRRRCCLYPFHKQGSTKPHEHDTPACPHPPRAISLLALAPPPPHPLTSIEKINAIHYHHRREEIQGQKGAQRFASPLLTHSSRVVTSRTGGRDEQLPCAHALRSLKVGGAGEERGSRRGFRRWAETLALRVTPSANVLILFLVLYLDPTHVNLARRMLATHPKALRSLSHI